MRSIKEIQNLEGKRVLVRVDFNVPIKDGVIEDDFRIKKAIPTLEFLLEKGASLTLVTHLGDGSQNLDSVVERFFEISNFPQERVKFMPNVRQFPGEEKNDEEFAKELAKEGDIYVNDAFPVSHREHASIVGVPKFLPSYAGFQLEKEVANLSRAFDNTEHPFLFILGGAKFSTKMPLIKRFLEIADHVFIGGALADDFLQAEGYEVGKSLVDEESDPAESLFQNKKLILPTDVMVESLGSLVAKKVNEISKNETIIDIGPESVKNLEELVKKSKFILWNGPLGKYEAGGEGATKEILKAVAASDAESIIGGGDTVELVSELKMEDKFTFVSTGGGATLDFLVDGTLPESKLLSNLSFIYKGF